MAEMFPPNKIQFPTWRLQRSCVQHEIYSPRALPLLGNKLCSLINIGAGLPV